MEMMPQAAPMKTGVSTVSSPIRRQSLTAAVLERLREKIISGEFHEGEQLRQDAIAAEFQVSRVPVREALNHLAAEGLITIVANHGAVVSALSPDEIMQLFETRAVLECFMIRKAIPNFTSEDFQRAEEILKQFEQSLEKEAEMQKWGRLNWMFHAALYAPAHRPVVMSMLKTLNNNCDRYTRLHLAFTRQLRQAGPAHRSLFELCRSGDPEKISAALWKHIIDAGEYLRDFIKQRREQHG
jgi:DNA-binding GntR family transcriptional regulator